MMFEFPSAFIRRMHDQGIDHEKLFSMRTRKCIRFVRNNKIPENISQEIEKLEKVKWWPAAFWIEKPADFSQKEEFRKGLYYIQDPVSLIPVMLLKLVSSKPLSVLDMCAAPGTKSVIISEILEKNKNPRFVANDKNFRRIPVLEMNLRKYKCSYTLSRNDGRLMQGNFDRILVDAPCSGEGMVNKKEKVFSIWSEKRVKRLSALQFSLLKNAFSLLNKNGVLVYSTCTFEREENEDNVERLINDTGAGVEKISLKNVSYEKTENGIRIYPWHNGTGGFFVSVIRKQ